MTSAMPDMPMPPMPTKWMVPMSVPIAFNIEGPAKDAVMRHSIGELGADTRGQLRTHQRRREAFANPLDEVGEVARGVRPPDRQRALGGIVERDRVGRHRLDLAGEHVRREAGLLDGARAARFGHFARIGGLVVVGRGRKRDQDRRTPGGGQLGDGRRAGAANHQMRVGKLVGHVLDIGHQLGRNAELGITVADALDIVRAALLDDLQPPAQRRLEQAEALGYDLAKHRRSLTSAGDQDFQRRDLVERRERQFAQRAPPPRVRGCRPARICPDRAFFSRSTFS